VEDAVGGLSGVRKGCVAAFGVTDAGAGTERLVIVAERRGDPAADESLRAEIQSLAVSMLGGPADEVALVPPQVIPKTSSGKLRRSACRDLYLSGALFARRHGPVRQLAAIAWAGWRGSLRRSRREILAWGYNAWVWCVVLLSALPVFLAVVLTPGETRRRRVAGKASRAVLWWAGIPLAVSAGGEGATSGPLVYCPNHASYADGLVLTAALGRVARPPVFVVKSELTKVPLVRLLLRRLGAVFVERFDTAQSAADARQVAARVAAGRSIVVFPEGTFHRGAGLRSFRLGAFVTAAESGAAIVPVAIEGTRSLMRGDDYFFRRAPVRVTVLPAIHPGGQDFSAAVALRDAVREALLAQLGEADLQAVGP
jgi:1-acyl-sn-glycerol-3-phosphate acyltransferase